jgi:hypothetical protein
MTKEKLRPCAFFDGSRKKTEKRKKDRVSKRPLSFFAAKTGIFPYGPEKDAAFLP